MKELKKFQEGMALHIAICDDDKNAQEQLAKQIMDWADDRKTGIELRYYDSAESFMMSWPEVSCDLVFLDIKMKNIDGVQLAGNIRKKDRNIIIVFVTSFYQYSLYGYNVEALNYLIKPVSAAKLLPTLDKACLIYNSRRNSFLIGTNGKDQCKVFLDDIYYISMSAHYAEVFTADASYTVRKSAKELEELLPEYFIRCHRSHFANMFKVERICGNSSLVMLNQKELPLSRNNVKRVKEAFIRFQVR